MVFDGDLRHLTSEQIQEFLDRQLSSKEETLVREHLAACPRCQSEAEAWELLFSDLSELPVLDPEPMFQDAVMEQAPVRRPFGSLAGGWKAARRAKRRQELHIPVGSIQDYLEDLLPAQPKARVEAHLAACSSCNREIEEWHTLLNSFEPLGHFAPQPGFAERVMAQVMVPAPVPVAREGFSSLPGRVVSWVRNLFPNTRHGWAVAGGVASAPTITIAALVYLVFSRPLVTPGTFGAYVFWKGSALFDLVANIVSTRVLESALFLQARALLEPFTQSPLLLGVGGLVFSLFSAGALWVLYRNLIVTPSDDRYARARV